MQYIGVDLAWGINNTSGITLLDDDEVKESFTVSSLYEVIDYIKKYPKAIVGVDAPLLVENESGNRDIEKEFLKDYSSKKLGIYPVNKKLMTKNQDTIAGVELNKNITQILGKNLFEVYPHVTIMNCFHNKVLPYKRKQGRNTEFIKEQLQILENYLTKNLKGDFKEDIPKLKGKALKNYEDKLDSIVCAYTLYFCETNDYNLYGGIFKVPNSVLI